MPLPDPIEATAADLPRAVAAALDDPPMPNLISAEAAGIRFAARTWGDPAGEPLLLIHGVTSSSRIWWRIGPALAAGLGRHVVAVDQAGHGASGKWTGHHRFRDNAADIVAFAVAAGLAGPELRVVGHSWGAMTVAAIPAAGLRPEVVVLVDPGALSLVSLAAMLDDPVEHHYDDVTAAAEAIGRLHPTWPWGDVVGKAEALTQFDEGAARAVLTENGDWDGGLADLSDPAARGVGFRLIRGQPAFGGLLPDAAAERIAERIGQHHVTTIAGGTHSPMRLQPEATVLALMRALEPD